MPCQACVCVNRQDLVIPCIYQIYDSHLLLSSFHWARPQLELLGAHFGNPPMILSPKPQPLLRSCLSAKAAQHHNDAPKLSLREIPISLADSSLHVFMGYSSYLPACPLDNLRLGGKSAT
jgi:hypothetical protein